MSMTPEEQFRHLLSLVRDPDNGPNDFRIPGEYEPSTPTWYGDERAQAILDKWAEKTTYRCVGGHDRCYGGASVGPECPYCEPTIQGAAL